MLYRVLVIILCLTSAHCAHSSSPQAEVETKAPTEDQINQKFVKISHALSRLGEVIASKVDDTNKKISPEVNRKWDEAVTKVEDLGKKIGNSTEEGVGKALDALEEAIESLAEKLESTTQKE